MAKQLFVSEVKTYVSSLSHKQLKIQLRNELQHSSLTLFAQHLRQQLPTWALFDVLCFRGWVCTVPWCFLFSASLPSVSMMPVFLLCFLQTDGSALWRKRQECNFVCVPQLHFSWILLTSSSVQNVMIEYLFNALVLLTPPSYICFTNACNYPGNKTAWNTA